MNTEDCLTMAAKALDLDEMPPDPLRRYHVAAQWEQAAKMAEANEIAKERNIHLSEISLQLSHIEMNTRPKP